MLLGIQNYIRRGCNYKVSMIVEEGWGPGFTQIIINYKSLVTNCYVVLLGYFDASYKQNIT